MKKRIGALLLALVMLLSMLSGCGADAPAADDTADGQTEESTEADTGDEASEANDSVSEDQTGLTEVPEEARQDPVSYITDGAITMSDTVMTVNGAEIPAGVYFYWLAYQYTYTAYTYSMYGYTLDVTETVDDAGTTMADSFAVQAQTFTQLNSVLQSQAQSLGLELTEEQLSGLDGLEADYDANTRLFYATDLDSLKSIYEASCIAANVKDYYYGENGSAAPTQETLADYAEENGVYTCRYILLNTSELEEDDEEGRAAQLTQAQELYEQLKACSAETLEETFTQLQTDYNYDGNTEPYTFDADDSLVSGFREKVAELAVGELGLTEETDYGYFVLLRLDTDLSSVEDEYTSSAYDAQISQWMEEAQVETSDALANLDVTACFERLIDLQTALTNELIAAEEAASEDDAESDAADETTDAGTDAEG